MIVTVYEDGREPVRCHSIAAAQHYVEDRATEVHDSHRDPNSADRQPYPGVQYHTIGGRLYGLSGTREWYITTRGEDYES